MPELLVDIQQLVTATVSAGADTVDPEKLAEPTHRFRSAVQIGITDTADRSNPLTRKHNALARRLHDRHDDYLRFTTNPAIPPDNNGSERDIRMIKLREKVSGCQRTLTGAQQ